MTFTFDTPEPVIVDLAVAVGSVTLDAQPGCRTSTVELEGDADYLRDFDVRLDGRTLVVHAPDRSIAVSLFGFNIALGQSGAPRVRVRITVPIASDVTAEAGAATLELHGEFEHVATVQGSGGLRADSAHSLEAKAGSGGVRCGTVAADATVTTGSGGIRLDSVGGALHAQCGSGGVRVDGDVGGDAHVRSGSGSIQLGNVGGEAELQAGSGSISVGVVGGPAALRATSGTIKLAQATDRVTATTVSGTVDVGYVGPGECTLSAVSGTIKAVVAPGMPVWAELNTISGTVRNDIVPVGDPEPGEPTLRLTCNTVSGTMKLSTASSPA